jgi:hypothetical protein
MMAFDIVVIVLERVVRASNAVVASRRFRDRDVARLHRWATAAWAVARPCRMLPSLARTLLTEQRRGGDEETMMRKTRRLAFVLGTLSLTWAAGAAAQQQAAPASAPQAQPSPAASAPAAVPAASAAPVPPAQPSAPAAAPAPYAAPGYTAPAAAPVPYAAPGYTAPAAAPAPYAAPGYPTPVVTEYRPRLMGPKQLRYVAGEEPPPGYHVEEQSRRGLTIGGATVFGAPYLIGFMVGFFNEFEDDTGWLALPIAGPFILASKRERCDRLESEFGCDNDDDDGRSILILDGLMQATGAVLFAWGVSSRKKVLIRDDVALTLVPRIGTKAVGLGATGRF